MLMLIAICTILAAWSFFLGIRLWSSVRTRTYLLRHGIAVPARIVEEQPYQTMDSRMTRITYEFTDADGHVVRGTRWGLPSLSQRQRLPSLAADYARAVDHPMVLYDPRDSRRSMLR